jgi:hypothetical protein
MKYSRISLVLLLTAILHINLSAQVDSVKIKSKRSFGKSLILPLSFGTAGMIVKESSFRVSFQKDVQTSRWRTNNHVDDFIQYAPIAELYTVDIFYGKTKNQIFQQTKNLAISEILTALIVQGLKKTTKITRPNGSPYSFPSGHTAQSFTGATALYLEYKNENSFIAYSGYGFSTATGILRITNNKHWLSDVLVGAGIGIFTAQLTWCIDPFKNWTPFKSKRIALYPYVNGLDSSAGLCMVF